TRLQGDWSSDVCSSDLFFVHSRTMRRPRWCSSEPTKGTDLSLRNCDFIHSILLSLLHFLRYAAAAACSSLTPGWARLNSFNTSAYSSIQSRVVSLRPASARTRWLTAAASSAL